MDSYCKCCDKTFKFKSKKDNLKLLTHIEYGKCFRLYLTIKNPEFLDIDNIIDEYITNRKKCFSSCQIRFQIST